MPGGQGWIAVWGIVILRAGGRDFFHAIYGDDPAVEVAAITAAQIPGIAGRQRHACRTLQSARKTI